MVLKLQFARRPLGTTGLSVTELGFGAAAIGNLYRHIDDRSARAAVEAVFDSGVRFMDTAPYYGFGLSEKRLAEALSALDQAGDVILSTKVGRLLEWDPHADTRQPRECFVSPMPFRAVFDYSYDGVMRSFEESRTRLGRRIDVLLAHDLGYRTHGDAHAARFDKFMTGGYRAMRELRDCGEITAIGLGANEWQVCEQALAAGQFDCFLLAGRYTLLEQGALDSFLPLCEARGASIILGGPLNSGILGTGVKKGAGAPHYDYGAPSADIIARVARIEAACDLFSVPLAAAALQFPLGHCQVASIIPGMASEAEVMRALSLFFYPIPSELWECLRREGLLHHAAPVPNNVRHKKWTLA